MEIGLEGRHDVARVRDDTELPALRERGNGPGHNRGGEEGHDANLCEAPVVHLHVEALGPLLRGHALARAEGVEEVERHGVDHRVEGGEAADGWDSLGVINTGWFIGGGGGVN